LAVYLAKKPVPGLPIVPPWEIEKPEQLAPGDKVTRATTLACMKCGTTVPLAAKSNVEACSNCGHRHFTHAQTAPQFDARTDD
jgi:DNA-directed RNA polymerase subunit RPC12/RpoP